MTLRPFEISLDKIDVDDLAPNRNESRKLKAEFNLDGYPDNLIRAERL